MRDKRQAAADYMEALKEVRLKERKKQRLVDMENHQREREERLIALKKALAEWGNNQPAKLRKLVSEKRLASHLAMEDRIELGQLIVDPEDPESRLAMCVARNRVDAIHKDEFDSVSRLKRSSYKGGDATYKAGEDRKALYQKLAGEVCRDHPSWKSKSRVAREIRKRLVETDAEKHSVDTIRQRIKLPS